MFTATKFALRLAVILGMAMTHATANEPAYRQPPPTAPRELSSNGHAGIGIAHGPGQITRAAAVYSEAKSTPFTAFTYSASVQLTPSTSTRVLQGIQVPAFQRGTQCIGTNRFLVRRRSHASSRRQNRGNCRDVRRERDTNHRRGANDLRCPRERDLLRQSRGDRRASPLIERRVHRAVPVSQGNGPEAPITISSTVEYRFPDASLDHP